MRAVSSIARALSDGTGTLVGAEFFGTTNDEQQAFARKLEEQYAGKTV